MLTISGGATQLATRMSHLLSIMISFYKTFILPVLSFNFISWYRALPVQSKNKLNKIVQIAGKTIGCQLESLQTTYRNHVLKKVDKILKDTTHNLYAEYCLLPSGRRLRQWHCSTKRSQQSFVFTSIRLYN